jgi:hypothetical protein
MAKKFVWRCTPQSIENRQLSVASCVEIGFSVCLYWSIWYYFDTHLHLISSLIAAPFLLFRSPESIQQGIVWFEKKVSLKSAPGFGLMLVLATITFVLCWLWVNAWLSGYEGFALFWRAVVIGVFGVGLGCGLGIASGNENVAGAGAVIVATVMVAGLGAAAVAGVGAVAVAGVGVGADKKTYILSIIIPPMFLIIFPSFVTGIWLYTVFIRLFATLRYLPAGLRYFAENWQENMFAVDLWHPPTLLPGAKDLSGQKFLNDFANEDLIGKTLSLPPLYLHPSPPLPLEH